MGITTLSSWEISQDTTPAKEASSKGSVFIADGGKAAHVLLSIEEDKRPTGPGISLVEALSMPGLADVEFDPLKTQISMRPADLS